MQHKAECVEDTAETVQYTGLVLDFVRLVVAVKQYVVRVHEWWNGHLCLRAPLDVRLGGGGDPLLLFLGLQIFP